MVFFFQKTSISLALLRNFSVTFHGNYLRENQDTLFSPNLLKTPCSLRVKEREEISLTINTRILRVIARVKFNTHVVYFACKSAKLHAIYTRVNAATPVTCIVILTFNRNCEDYNDQNDIYPREHQFPQGLLCADFLRILVTSGSEVQGILKALAH